MILGLPLGIWMARHKNKFPDHLGTVFIVIIQAVPSAVYYLFIQLYGTELFGLSLLFKVDDWRTWILPVFSLSLPNIIYYAMWIRRYTVDQSTKDYVQLAKIKGLSDTQTLYRHVFRNAFVPMVQYLPTSFLNTVVGSIYIESLYAVPGMALAFFLLLWIPSSNFFKKHYPHPYQEEVEKRGNTGEGKTLAASFWTRKEISLIDLATTIAISFVIVAVSTKIATFFKGTFSFFVLQQILGNQFVILTIITVALATAFPKFFANLRGAQEIGTFLIYMSMGLTLFLTVLLFIFCRPLIRIFNQDPGVLHYGARFIQLMSPFYVLCCINQIYAGSLRGAGDAKAPML